MKQFSRSMNAISAVPLAPIALFPKFSFIILVLIISETANAFNSGTVDIMKEKLLFKSSKKLFEHCSLT